ncbi:UbiA family prenyltransferase [Planctomicrobium sp.]|jgi:4-hydroxybenzoate polyprenyltransferase|nr:UbiA family prenyltransferase [Planctomicrobium sp.]MDB4439757.1 UbiA family prenyltransferase [Planctomicrobium sp.]
MMRYLRLCRFPTVFTALADIAAGFLLSHAALQPTSEFVLLLAASACLYLSGMVFNDVFDVKQDTAERPSRPIPSGAVSRRNAAIFAIALMSAGLGFAYCADLRSLMIAGMLAVCILLYDSSMKRTPVGPIFMGACRSLNLFLGASTAGIRLAAAFQQPLLWIALCMGIYIAGVTWFAKREAKMNLRLPLLLSTIVINLGLVGLALWLGDFATQLGLPLPPGIANSKSVLILWGVIAFTINRRTIVAILDPSPAKIQPAIGVMLLSVIVLNATFVFFKFGNEGIPYVAGILLLLIPAVLLRKVIPMT